MTHSPTAMPLQPQTEEPKAPRTRRAASTKKVPAAKGVTNSAPEAARPETEPFLEQTQGAACETPAVPVLLDMKPAAEQTTLLSSAERQTEEQEDTPLSTAVLPESSVVADSLEHGQRVAVIVAQLFQDLTELHNLDDIWGHRLHLAAQLHDIGFAEGRKGHHKVSMRIIEEDLSLNIQDEDRPWVALLARYHRKAWPSNKHERFAALNRKERKALSKAASLLRIADALDYTHKGLVKRFEVMVKKHKVIITLHCSGDCLAEMERVLKKGDLFMHIFERELECVCQAN